MSLLPLFVIIITKKTTGGMVTMKELMHTIFLINNVHLSCAHQRPERSHDTY